MSKFLAAAALFLHSLTCAASPADDKRVPAITLESEVSDDTVDATSKAIQDANDAGAEKIVLVIDSPGGSVVAGWRLSRVIEASKAPVVCVVDGMAASMAFYVLQSCQVRAMTRSSLLMAHQAALGGQGGQEKDWESGAEVLRHLDRALAEHEATRMGMPVAAFLAKIADGHEWWMNWDEALQTSHAVDMAVDSVSALLRSLRTPPP